MRRRLGLAVDFMVPMLAVVALAAAVYVKIDTGQAIAHNAKSDAVGACDAVHDSDVELHDYLERTIATGSRANDPQLQRFLRELADSQDKVYAKCLQKIGGA